MRQDTDPKPTVVFKTSSDIEYYCEVYSHGESSEFDEQEWVKRESFEEIVDNNKFLRNEAAMYLKKNSLFWKEVVKLSQCPEMNDDL